MQSTPIDHGFVTMTAMEMVVLAYGSMFNKTLPAKYAVVESIPVTRKHCRDDSYPSFPNTIVQNQNQKSRCSSFMTIKIFRPRSISNNWKSIDLSHNTLRK